MNSLFYIIKCIYATWAPLKHVAHSYDKSKLFCNDFINSYLLPKTFEDELVEIRLHLRSGNIDQSLGWIFKELFLGGVNLGPLIAIIGFIRILCS